MPKRILKLVVAPGLLILVMCISACSGGESVEKAADQNSKGFQSFKIDINSPQVPLGELIERVEVLGLEETDSSLLSYANQVFSFEDKLVFPSGRKGEIFVYNNQGEFINKFGHKGDGPGEYASLKSLWMKADSILVFDHDKASLLYYGLDGGHLKTVKFKDRPTHVMHHEGNYLMEISFQPLEDSLKYRLVIQNEQLERIGLYLPYEKELPFPVYSNINSFKPSGDQMFFQPTFHDTIYQVSSEGVIPAFSIDFGEDYFWDDETLFDNPNGVMSLIGERNQVWIFNTFIGQEKSILNFNTSFRDFYQGVLDKKTGTFQRMDLKRTAEDRFTFITVRPDRDGFLLGLPSIELAEFMEEVGKAKFSFRADWSLEKIESSENPLLMWVKFR